MKIGISSEKIDTFEKYDFFSKFDTLMFSKFENFFNIRLFHLNPAVAPCSVMINVARWRTRWSLQELESCIYDTVTNTVRELP
jgi:hypothetical protein